MAQGSRALHKGIPVSSDDVGLRTFQWADMAKSWVALSRVWPVPRCSDFSGVLDEHHSDFLMFQYPKVDYRNRLRQLAQGLF